MKIKTVTIELENGDRMIVEGQGLQRIEWSTEYGWLVEGNKQHYTGNNATRIKLEVVGFWQDRIDGCDMCGGVGGDFHNRRPAHNLLGVWRYGED